MYHAKGLMGRIGMIMLWVALDTILLFIILLGSLERLSKIFLIILMIVSLTYSIVDFIVYKKHVDKTIQQQKEENNDKEN
ncbi:MAG: hypothetical protein WCQ80_02160 [Bacilli bacterium]